MDPVIVIGSYLSPYVRKVLVSLVLKGIPYRIDPIVPFFGNDDFSRLSPLRRIPVLIDRDVTLCDSTIICEYLDERYPEISLYPEGAVDRARCRWLEEYADSRMGEVFIWRYFNQLVIRRAVWGETADPSVLDKAVNVEIPSVMDYLETQVPPTGFLFDEEQLSIADIAIAAVTRNAFFAGFTVDETRWPVTADYIARVLGTAPFEALAPFEQKLLRTPIDKHRAALNEAGAPLTEQSWGSSSPQRGIMSI